MIVGFKSNLRSTWEKFLRKFLPHYEIHFSWETYVAAMGGKKRVGKRSILLIHYEGLGKIIGKVERHKFDVVIYDEIHRLKSRGSATSRFARRLRHVPYRLGLSGTPMDDSPNQLWAIMRFIEPAALGVQVSDYESFFTKPSGYMGKKRKFREERHEIFLRRVEPFIYRVTKEDAGVKRSKIRWMPVHMKGRQEEIYRELERDMMVDLDGNFITTPLKITQIGKLQQITGGYLIDEEKERHVVGKAKLKVIRRLLLEEDELPIVIFCKYTHEVNELVALCKKIFNRVEKIDGSVKDRIYKRKPNDLRRTKIVEAFQRGEIDALVCQQRTGGVGLDMFRSSFAIVYSYSHSWIDFDQMASRLDAMGKEENSEMLVLFVPNTIDEDIRTSIKMKVSVTEATLNRLRRKDQSWQKQRRNRRQQPVRQPQRKRPQSRTSTASKKSPRRRA